MKESGVWCKYLQQTPLSKTLMPLHLRSVLVVLAASTCAAVSSRCAPPLWAQTVPAPNAATKMPALETSAAIWSNAPIILRLPPGSVPPRDARLGLFEAGRPTRVAETKRDWQLVNGRWQTTVRVEADAGAYEWRVLQSDRDRTPLSAAAPLLVPGIEREPGWWLLDGSPFSSAVAENPTNSTAASTAPRANFVSGLRRSPKAKTSTQIKTAAPLSAANTLPLPDLSDSDAYQSANLRREIATRLAAAPSNAPLLAWTIEAGAQVSDETALNRLLLARAASENLTPGAAIVLRVVDGDALQVLAGAHLIDAIAPECDAVWIAQQSTAENAVNQGAFWLLKVARRVAEESPDLDLPIVFSPTFPEQELPAMLLGATAFWNALASPNDAQNVADWRAIVQRNLPLFVGSVTLEDSGLLLPTVHDDANTARAMLDLFSLWRVLGRVPLLARDEDEARRRNKGNRIDTRSGESFALDVTSGTGADANTLKKVLEATDDGARVLLLGNPLTFAQNTDPNPYAAPVANSHTTREKAPVAPANWRELLIADAKPMAPKRSGMTPENPWIFGTARGEKVTVEQSSVIVPTRTPAPDEIDNAASKAAQKADKKTPVPLVVARLEDGSPGVLLVPSRRVPDERTAVREAKSSGCRTRS